MSKIPETGPFTFGDVITEFGAKVESLGLDKYKLSSYLGITTGIPTEAPLLLSAFRGKSNPLIIRTSQIIAALPTVVNIHIPYWFVNIHSIEVCNQHADFVYIHDVDFKGAVDTGSLNLNQSTSLVGGFVYLGAQWGAGTTLHMQLEAKLEGMDHGLPSLNSLDAGINWTFNVTPSTPSHKYYTSGTGYASAAHNYLGTSAGNSLTLNRSITLHRVSGLISGGDGKGGDIRLAYAEAHGRKYIGKRYVAGQKGAAGTYVDNDPTYSVFTAYAYAMIPGARSANPSPPFMQKSVLKLTSADDILARMNNFISSKTLATETTYPSIGLNNETYQGTGLGMRTARVAQPNMGRDWILRGKGNGGDRILSIFNHYFETVDDSGATPAPLVIGGIIFNKMWVRTDAPITAGKDGVVLNGHTLTITEA